MASIPQVFVHGRALKETSLIAGGKAHKLKKNQRGQVLAEFRCISHFLPFNLDFWAWYKVTGTAFRGEILMMIEVAAIRIRSDSVSAAQNIGELCR